MRFDMTHEANGIEHRRTKLNHPWTKGQFECMKRTIEDAAVNQFRDDSHYQHCGHLADFLDAYNFARRLKALGGFMPNE